MSVVKKMLVEISTVCLFLILWFWRYQAVRIVPPLNSASVSVRAVLKEEPLISGARQSFRLNQIYIRTRAWPRYDYGDYLLVEGELKPEMTMSYPKITLIESGQGSALVSWLYQTRSFLSGQINNYLPEPQSGLLNGFLLGIKGGLMPGFSDQLRRTGTIHAVVVSGYNISVVAGVLLALTMWSGRLPSFIASVLGVLLFTLMVGADPPVMRAAVMGMMMLLGKYLGRPRITLRLVVLSGLILAVVDPLMPLTLSFQLSFAATIGLVVVEPLLHGLAVKIWPWASLPAILGAFIETLAAQVMVWPLIAWRFGTFSIISPLINALVGGVIPASMFLGLLIIVGSLFLNPIAQLSSWIAWVLLSFFVRAVEFGSSLTWAQANLKVGGGVVAGYYFLLMILLYLRFRARNLKRAEFGAKN